MDNPAPEIPADWQADLDELKDRVANLPEDIEDQWIREGQAAYDAMTPEEQADWDRKTDEAFTRFQKPGAMEGIDRVFRAES
ncbi:MAG: hypothetical protein QG553_394 [Patescibacteria group bacterium]|nr:hypothetical protein [Patescibacteria group bacterium]